MKELLKNYDNKLKLVIILLNLCFNLGVYYLKGISVDGLILAIVFFILLITSIEDIRTFTISNKIIIIILMIGLINVINKGEYLSNILGAFFIFTFFIVSSILGFKIGMGDIKLISVATLLTGFKGAITAFVIGIFLSVLVGAILIISKKITFKSKFALAPFFSLGIILVLLFNR